jgi:transcriptional regulator with XRE-family HTH domain
MDSRAVIRVLREQGLSQGELAARAHVARETLSRWESGAQHPSLESLRRVVAAAGAELDVRVVAADLKLVELARDQLAINPAERLSGLVGDSWPGCRDALRAARVVGDVAVVVGPVAAALQGAPQRPGDGRVDLLVAPGDLAALNKRLIGQGAWPDGFEQAPSGRGRRERWQAGRGELTVQPAANAIALRDRASAVAWDATNGDATRVALVEDLLEMAETSPWPGDAVYRAGLRAVLASGRYTSRPRRAGGR